MAKNIANQPKEKIQKLFDKAKEYIDNPKTEQEGVELLIELMQTSLRERAIFELYMLRIKNNDFEQAQACLTAIEKIPNSKYISRAKIEKGRICAKNDQINEAIQCYIEAIEVGSRNDYFYANFELAKLYIEMDNKEAAKKCFLNIIKRKDISVDITFVQYELGKLYSYEGNDEEAKKHFEKVIRADSSFKPSALIELGKVFARNDQINEAIQCYIEAKEIGNEIDYFYASFELGKLYAEINNNEAAKECFQDIINRKDINKKDVYSDITNAQYELGRIYVSEGNDEEAKKYFDEIIKTNSKTKVSSILELGKLYAREGNIELAESLFTRIIGKNDHAIERLIFLAIKANNLPEASRLLNELSPTIDNYEDIKAYVLYKTGKKDEITTSSYFTMQLLDYKRENAISHIQRHLYENMLRKIHTLFNSDVDVNALFDEVKNKLNNSCLIDSTNVEKYIICCDNNIATINGEETNCVVVLTIPCTENIITIYPTKQMKKAKQLSIGSLDR